jgi:hypothetical protein
MDAEKSLRALHTFTLDGANGDAAEKSIAPSITESLNYLIQTVIVRATNRKCETRS